MKAHSYAENGTIEAYNMNAGALLGTATGTATKGLAPMPDKPTIPTSTTRRARMPRVTLICPVCNRQFTRKASDLYTGHTHCCSYPCALEARRFVVKDHESRFWPKVDKSGDCWLWTASLDKNGYGKFWDGSRLRMAHRVAYEYLVGAIPDGLVIDHLCRTPACVNPDHMEPVTVSENIRRGVGASVANARKTHCCRGHAFTPENTHVNSRGDRRCRECGRMHDAQRYRDSKHR